jgi:hypothetical protein
MHGLSQLTRKLLASLYHRQTQYILLKVISPQSCSRT